MIQSIYKELINLKNKVYSLYISPWIFSLSLRACTAWLVHRNNFWNSHCAVLGHWKVVEEPEIIANYWVKIEFIRSEFKITLPFNIKLDTLRAFTRAGCTCFCERLKSSDLEYKHLVRNNTNKYCYIKPIILLSICSENALAMKLYKVQIVRNRAAFVRVFYIRDTCGIASLQLISKMPRKFLKNKAPQVIK